MIGTLDDAHHERLWRICDALVSGAGARAAMVCDASTGAVLVCVGDATGRGSVAGVEPLGPGERVVHGDGGEIYGVDIPGGALLAVLHEREVVERIRAAAVTAVAEAADLLAHLPPPPPPPPWPPVHSHGAGIAPARRTASRKNATRGDWPAPKKKAAPAKRKTAPAKKATARKKPAARKQAPRRRAAPSRKRPPKAKRAPGAKSGARKKAKRRR